MVNLKEKYPDLFYPVEKIPFKDYFPEMETNSYNSHLIIVDKGSHKKVVKSCSDIYQVISNEDVIYPLMAALSEIYSVRVVPRIYQDAVFKFDFVIDFPIDMGKRYANDPIFPSISVDNSYNGKRKLGAVFSILRQVCTNGMMVSETLFPGENFMHTPSSGNNLAVEKVVDMLAHFMERLDEFLEPFEDLRGAPVFNLHHRVEEVLEATKFPVSQAEAVLDRIAFEQQTLGLPATDWLVYNGFNFVLNHSEEIEMPPYKRSQLDQQVQLFLLDQI